MAVQFDEEEVCVPTKALEKKLPLATQLVLKTKIVKTEQGAIAVLTILIILIASLSLYIFSESTPEPPPPPHLIGGFVVP